MLGNIFETIMRAIYMRRNYGILLVFTAILVLTIGCSSPNFADSDQAALDSLRDAGSDLAKTHPFDFYFYHNNKAGAQFICAELEKDGFHAAVQEGAIEGEWLCLASMSFIPSIEKLTDVQSVFDELISTYGGEYDGWETVVIPK
ncbi:MAG: ribonuclease E inhibitor RraB [Anaerolineales bacterium]|nr:ribonuclease E inhibitor RraB [Anaerolineales bacterium]